MTDLERQFEALDRVPAPDLWTDVVTRQPRPRRQRGDLHRPVTAIVVLLVATASLGLVYRAFVAGPDDGPRPTWLSVSGRADGVPLECTMRVPSSAGPGDEVGARFRYRNVGSEPLILAADGTFGRLLVDSADGRRLWDTRLGGYPGGGLPAKLEPGEQVDLRSGFVALWGGKLRVSPRCEYGLVDDLSPVTSEPIEEGDAGSIELAPVRIDVVGEGAEPNREEALSRALAATGGLFNSCRPTADGAPARGTIAPPLETPFSIERIAATCRAHVETHPGSALIDLFFASPPGLPLPASPPPDESWSRGLRLPEGADGMLVRWTMLVLGDEVRHVRPDLHPTTAGPSGVFRPPAGCREAPSPCAGVVFAFVDGRWEQTRTGPTGFHSGHVLGGFDGISFVAPVDASDSESRVLASGEVDGARWEYVAALNPKGIWAGVRWPNQDHAGGFTLYEGPLRRPCRFDPGHVFDPKTWTLFMEGRVSDEVTRVTLELADGRRVQGQLIDLPPGWKAGFKGFVAIIPDYMGSSARDAIITTASGTCSGGSDWGP